MKVPCPLETAYQGDHKLASFVSTALSGITNHVTSNRMVFFPEYTDHGIHHFELVLQTSFDLCTNKARDLLTPADAAALTVSVALHDFGMHLTRDGFETLISKDSRWGGIAYFDKKHWSTLWEDFFAEASRFDGRKLRALFGENYRPARPLPAIGSQWEDFDYLLVGEFLRQHHPRLAHDIALNGLPAKDGHSITVCPVSTEEELFLADISGLIARSHGMELRSCLSYLEHRYSNKINPRGIHAAFLSVLLRIADYFQIQAQRAPTGRTEVSSFQSTLSAREWKVHQCVSDIHNTGSDPEAIVIIAGPTEVDTFLRIKSWLSGIQEELDRSWAILGEVYGLQKHNNLNDLGLKIRRVKSNLDDATTFAKGVNYVPARVAFEAANADLLKLLVAPLYNDDPAIGIRELIQNSIDAVREFDDYAIHRPEVTSLERYDQPADVLLRVDCDASGLPTTVTIIDRGVGMTAQIIQEYFLKAGASFRKSNAWRQDHEDAPGHSRVLRTGRFGVGALAAFLLGDEIEVTTRHVFSPETEGVTFRARLDDEAISLVRTRAPIGTKILINIPTRLQKHVSRIVPGKWEEFIHFNNPAGHYFLKKPSLKREFSNRSKRFEPLHWLPLPTDDDSTNWRAFSTGDFEKVFWSYRPSSPRLACNGIVINAYGHYDYGNDSYTHRDWLEAFFRRPNLSVFDKNGYLPVNLQRTGLQTEHFPFHEELVRSVTDDLIAYTLVEAPDRVKDEWFDGKYEGFIGRSNALGGMDQWAKWLVGRNGFVFNDPHLLRSLGPKSL
jgi:molecular chaperone HtpG